MKRSLLALLFGFSLLVSACAPANAPSDTSEAPSDGNEVVKVGYIGPLTGDAASFGDDDRVVVDMFMEENPEWGGKNVEIVFEDGKCNGQDAASAAQKLISTDGVSIILGGGCSGETLGLAPIVDRNKVIAYTSLSTSPEVSGVSDYVFRGAPSDAVSSEVLKDLLVGTYTKVAMVTQNNDYSSAFRRALQEKLPAVGVEIVVDEAFNSGTTDFKSILQKVKDSDAEALINIPGDVAPGGFVAKQARELGVELPMYGGDVLSGGEFFEIGKDATEGTTIVITAADRTRTDVNDLLSKFEARKGSPSNAEAYTLLTWDRLSVLKKAVDSVGFDADAIKDFLENMGPYNGLGGVTDFDENHDGNILPNVMVAKDGKFVIKK
jgi:branched-chain amino acid transport system substrate-binding protein